MRTGDGLRKARFGRASAVVAAGLAVFGSALPNRSSAATFETIHVFCPRGAATCIDGVSPEGELILDGSGHLYGTTAGGGGAKNGGTVFELTPNAAMTKWTERVLYHFCSRGGASCTDGKMPVAGLTRDAAGHLFGTTADGGAHDVAKQLTGTVFELTPDAAKTRWTETVLHSFGSRPLNADGAAPKAGLTKDSAGNLFGTTASGGAHRQGTAFELARNPTTGKWMQKVLHSFCSRGGASCTDGREPEAGLIRDASGSLYGTTSSDGAHGAGTAFELRHNAATGSWTETTLYDFCTIKINFQCMDGSDPQSTPIMKGAGHLFGTTLFGGAHDGGVVFELILNAAKTKWSERVLYNFCSRNRAGASCTDGKNPNGRLVMDKAGHLFGTTQFGGAHGDGVVFELALNAAGTEWAETVLHGFCARSEAGLCTDGKLPLAGVVTDRSGNLYGTTSAGGKGNSGTAFEVKR